MRAEDQESARLAWAEFFNRHFGYVEKVAAKALRRAIGDHAVQEIAQNSMLIRVFRESADLRGGWPAKPAAMSRRFGELAE